MSWIKYLLILLIPVTLFGQTSKRDWGNTDMIVRNIVVQGTVSGKFLLEFESQTQMLNFDFTNIDNGTRVHCRGVSANDGLFGPDLIWYDTSTKTADNLIVFDPSAPAGAGRLERRSARFGVTEMFYHLDVGNGATEDIFSATGFTNARSTVFDVLTEGYVDGRGPMVIEARYVVEVTSGGTITVTELSDTKLSVDANPTVSYAAAEAAGVVTFTLSHNPVAAGGDYTTYVKLNGEQVPLTKL